MGVCVVENLSRIFLFEWPHYNLWVMRVYIVWVKGKKVTLKKNPCIMFCDYLIGRSYPWDTRKTNNLAWFFSFQSWNKSWKHPENMFFTQKQLEKLWKTWVIQITSKNKHKEQKSFWFDPHMVENTHITFKHVPSHKWNRHSLNKSLVCFVWVSNVE